MTPPRGQVVETPLFVVCVFQEAGLLPTMLGYLPPDSRVMVFDGAFADFPHDDVSSTDGTLEIAERYGAEVVRASRAFATQIEKRNATLIEGEVVFILDADEFLVTPYVPLPPDADVGWVTFLSPVYDKPFLEPRIFRVGKGWHYDGRHHWIYDGDGDLVCSHRKTGEKYRHAVLPMVVDNAADLRPFDVRSKKRLFLNAMNARELRRDAE